MSTSAYTAITNGRNGGKAQGTLEWAMAIIARECADRTFGAVTVHLQDGKIVRVETQKHEVPEK